jgi:hypothetical protein
MVLIVVALVVNAISTPQRGPSVQAEALVGE